MIKKKLDLLEKYLARYRLIIGLLVLIMLCVTCILTYHNFDKQNQIIENGGFEDGKIKCVCSQEAWDTFQEEKGDISLPGLNFTDG